MKVDKYEEALSDEYLEYIAQVKKNAAVMAQAFTDLNYTIISGGTDNHLMLIDLRNKNITGKAAVQALGAAEITVNKNRIPYDDKSPFVTSGIRVGTAAVTSRGLKENDMEKIVELINAVILNPEDQAALSSVRAGSTSTGSEKPII